MPLIEAVQPLFLQPVFNVGQILEVTALTPKQKDFSRPMSVYNVTAS